MKLHIQARLDYELPREMDLLLQIEAAHLPEQTVESARLDTSECVHFARVAAHDEIGERIWLRAGGRFTAEYEATVAIDRIIADPAALACVPPHQLPGETVQYLMPSRYCPSDQFVSFVEAEFGGSEGGQRIAAIRDWVNSKFSYVPGTSGPDTTAIHSFVSRQGVCRDFAHVVITLARASEIPSRVAAVYALGVEPQDFHAVAEVFIGGEWHLVDATGMASEGVMAKIGVGRDAADVAFLTAFGTVRMNSQSVLVEAA